MFLNRLDIEKISKISKSFSNSEVFEIKQDTSSGIGAVTTLHVQTTIHGIEHKRWVHIKYIDLSESIEEFKKQ